MSSEQESFVFVAACRVRNCADKDTDIAAVHDGSKTKRHANKIQFSPVRGGGAICHVHVIVAVRVVVHRRIRKR